MSEDKPGAALRVAAIFAAALVASTALSTFPGQALAKSERGAEASEGRGGGNGNGGGNDDGGADKDNGNAGGNGNGGGNGNDGGDGGADSDHGGGPSERGIEASGGAAGGNGPSAKGIEASGGVAGGNPQPKAEEEEGLGSLNASHASPNARTHASENSAVGKLAGYEAAVLSGDFEAAARALDAASKRPVTLPVLNEVNANLGLVITDEQAMQILGAISY
jgi:hypothetical protein